MSQLPITYSNIIPANSEITVNAPGKFFYCVNADDAFEVLVDDGTFGFMAAGTGYEVEPGQPNFRELRLRNRTGSDINVELLIGRGKFIDNRLNVISNVSTSENVPDLITAADVAVADSTATQIIAANANRVEAIINNPSDSVDIRVGDSNVGASRGMVIGPKGTATLVTTTAIYCYQASGGSLDIPANYTERV